MCRPLGVIFRTVSVCCIMRPVIETITVVCFTYRIMRKHAHGFQAYDQKNIRRRVYDALNVLMAMNIISKEKKEIRWIGLPTNSAQECQNLEVGGCLRLL